jgi:starch phosphorylase
MYGQGLQLDSGLKAVFDAIKSNMFGDADQFAALVDGIVDHGDFYLVSDDFHSYCETQDQIDEAYKDKEGWLTKCITSVSRVSSSYASH